MEDTLVEPTLPTPAARGSTLPPGLGDTQARLDRAPRRAERAVRIGRANLGPLVGNPLDGGDAPGSSEFDLCVV